MVIFKALVGCHDILLLGKSPIKWRKRPDMTLAVDWDVKHQFKQTNSDNMTDVLMHILIYEIEIILMQVNVSTREYATTPTGPSTDRMGVNSHQKVYTQTSVHILFTRLQNLNKM